MDDYKEDNNNAMTIIVDHAALRYSKIRFVKTFLGLVFLIAGCSIACFLAITMYVISGLSEKNANSIEMVILLSFFIGSGIFLEKNLMGLYNRLFERQVSLVELGTDKFKLVIDNEQHIYEKNSIMKVWKEVSYRSSTIGTAAVLILTMNDRKYHFSSDTKPVVQIMYKKLKQWQEDQAALS